MVKHQVYSGQPWVKHYKGPGQRLGNTWSNFPDSIQCQGHTYDDYIKELYNDTASPPVLNPMAAINTKSDLDMTMMRAAINTRDFLLKYR